MEGDVVPGIVGFDRLRKQAIKGEGLVLAARHQALDDVTALEVVAAYLLDRDAPDDHRIEAVEGAEIAPDQAATLGGIGIEVRQVVEISRQRRLAMHGEGIAFGGK